MSLWDTIIINPLQTVALIIAALSVVTTVIIFIKNRKTKCLNYRIITNTPLLTVAEGLEGKIEIYYSEKYEDKKSIKDISVIIFEFLNQGNEAVKSADFEEEISLSFGPDVTILSAEQTDLLPRKLNVKFSFSKDKISLKPLLINPNDSFIIKFLFNGKYEARNFELRARIEGVTEIKEILSGETPMEKFNRLLDSNSDCTPRSKVGGTCEAPQHEDKDMVGEAH